MSNLSVNTITDASGGTTATVNGYTPTVSNMAGRNRIQNGDMRIDQRNAGASGNTNGFYPVDRFKQLMDGGGGVLTSQRSSTAPPNFTNSLLTTVSTADASITSTDYYSIQHKIEGHNIADLGWGTASASAVTLSFWVRSSVTGTFSGGLENNDANRGYVFTYTINAANTWEYKTITIAGDTTGTWYTDNNQGIQITFDLGTGTSRCITTANTWGAQRGFGLQSATKLISTLNATFYITGVQLEKGSVATPFDYRPYGTELALCQRYYWKLKQSDTSNQYTFGCGAVASSKDTFFIVNNPVQMRSAPTATQSGTVNVNYNASAYAKTSIGGQYAGTITTRITWNDASLVAGGATWFDFASGAYIDFSSEL